MKTYEATLVVVSHDRTFLNNIIHEVIDFRDKTLTYYKGDYISYEKVRAEHIRAQRTAYDAQQRQFRQMEEFIRKNEHSADPGLQKQVSQRRRDLEAMEKIPEPVEEKEVRWRFPEADALEKDRALVQISKMSFGYPLRQIPTAAVKDGKSAPGKDSKDTKDTKSSIPGGPPIASATPAAASGASATAAVPTDSKDTKSAAGDDDDDKVERSQLLKDIDLVIDQNSRVGGMCGGGPTIH